MVVSCVFFVERLIQYAPQLKTLVTWRIQITDIILLILYILVVTNGCLIWHTLMKGFTDFKMPFLKSLHIFFLAQLAKYAPGNIGHHVGRLYLTKKYQYNSLQVISAMIIENILPIIASCVFILYLLYVNQTSITEYTQTQLGNNALVYALMPIVLIFFAVFFIRNKILRISRKYVDENMRFRNILMSLILSFLNFIVLGFILLFLIKNHFSTTHDDFVLITSIFAVSWLLGFVTPGSPGGIGVREALLVLFLTPLYGEAISVWLSIMLRIITTVGDGLAFLIGMALAPYVNRLKNVNV